ncbi:MAG: hypothetical protein MMC33_002362 [Icmadophila ericetorum]|nr:hypothetical protein [Icmadophila ericetorum]
MASSVFFRFKSQKEPSRVIFDGTGISVFELKREIITTSRLGDGTDFELVIASEETGQEYDDDTAIVPRSTTVIAKRLPALKPGKGGAARYVSGKMPVNAKNSHRSEIQSSKPGSKNHTTNNTAATPNLADLKTEEERMTAVLKLGADQWQQQQQEMAHAVSVPTHRNGPMKGKPVNVPDRPPPPQYTCYRCMQKGHWIQVCPTNNDPAYDNLPRVKRTTGIPRTRLHKVEKPAALGTDGAEDGVKSLSSVMVNADGDWVVAEPDLASWEQYQAKQKVAASALEATARGSKELQDRGLECPIDKRLFVEPTKTPCCQKTYCNECISDALLDNDLHCPGCGKGLLIDDVIPDEEMVQKIRDYENEKVAPKSEEDAKSPVVKSEKSPVTTKAETTNTQKTTPSPSKSTSTVSSSTDTRKRPADTELENNRTAPSSQKALPDGISTSQFLKQGGPKPNSSSNSNFPTVFPSMPPTTSAGHLMSSFMGASLGNSAPFLGASMYPGPTMGNNMFDPTVAMQMNGFLGGAGNWGNMGATGFPTPNMYRGGGMFPDNSNMMANMGGYGQPNMAMSMSMMPNGMNTYSQSNGLNHNGQFSNQQRTTFSSTKPNEEDSAYFRKPVNPHRHQNRRNVNRPADYREI